VTGLSTRHVAERFQRSPTTIASKFNDILIRLSTAPFYTKHVRLPRADDPTPPEIACSTKWSPFFDNVIGAMDGTHISCVPSVEERQTARNRK
ncbi:hypothetical protein SISSUDRAFT_957182, partial [Sistotremastrum suecicum HHB10207 ss-3]